VEVPEVTQSEMGQKQKLREVLDMVNHLLNLTPAWVDQKWSVDSMFSSLLLLLVIITLLWNGTTRLSISLCCSGAEVHNGCF